MKSKYLVMPLAISLITCNLALAKLPANCLELLNLFSTKERIFLAQEMLQAQNIPHKDFIAQLEKITQSNLEPRAKKQFKALLINGDQQQFSNFFQRFFQTDRITQQQFMEYLNISGHIGNLPRIIDDVLQASAQDFFPSLKQAVLKNTLTYWHETTGNIRQLTPQLWGLTSDELLTHAKKLFRKVDDRITEQFSDRLSNQHLIGLYNWLEQIKYHDQDVYDLVIIKLQEGLNPGSLLNVVYEVELGKKEIFTHEKLVGHLLTAAGEQRGIKFKAPTMDNYRRIIDIYKRQLSPDNESNLSLWLNWLNYYYPEVYRYTMYKMKMCGDNYYHLGNSGFFELMKSLTQKLKYVKRDGNIFVELMPQDIFDLATEYLGKRFLLNP